MEVPQAVALAVKLSHAAKDLQPRLARTLHLRLSQVWQQCHTAPWTCGAGGT